MSDTRPQTVATSADRTSLERLQKWMQSVITNPDGIAAGIESSSARQEIATSAADIESVIGRSESLDSIDRLAVYGNAYFARLVECLGDTFPAVQHALGEETFAGFAVAYLQQNPSQSYTLDDLGRRFPAWLRETRPDDVPSPGWPDFLIDLATYEMTCHDIFDGPGVEGQPLLDGHSLTAIVPENIPRVVLRPAPCLQLLALQYPVHEYVTAVRREQSPSQPSPGETLLVLTRRDFVVRRGAISRAEFALLESLIAGSPLGEAVEAAVETTSAEIDQLAAQLSGWFQHWASAGWFVGFELVSE